MRRYRGHFGSFLLSLLTHLAALITVLVLGFLVAYILGRGIPNLRPEMFSLTYTSENQSMLPAASEAPSIWWNTRKRAAEL